MTDTPPAPPGEPNPPPAGGEPNPPAPSPTVDPTEPRDGDPPDLAAIRREAARYRRQLRDAETERDQLRGRVDQAERADVERLAAAAGMATPSDVWLIVRDVAELRRDGALDHDLAGERVKTILEERPTWKRPPPANGGGGSRLAGPAPKIGLSDLLSHRGRR